jgi:hypothetical protein
MSLQRVTVTNIPATYLHVMKLLIYYDRPVDINLS